MISFSSVQFIDFMQQLNDRMREQICRQWKRTKRHQRHFCMFCIFRYLCVTVYIQLFSFRAASVCL